MEDMIALLLQMRHKSYSYKNLIHQPVTLPPNQAVTKSSDIMFSGKNGTLGTTAK